ncbi:PrpF domain-containing protein [Citricoccus sp.]|uniref:PrpF domain-containing protein n=1 Tax=Citricoccus sp. TaxID=1978372 RepID=UPI0028BD1D82|nr:PrpF domain-containing protein [Citricoccus sp.]
MMINAHWMRGGTSKCWVFEASAVEATGFTADALLPRIFGSPDPRQLDGVGGATSTTSKALVVKREDGSVSDVSFTFAQVGIEEAKVDWGSNCGNCSAAVGLYAIEQGWVPMGDDVTEVRTFNTNTGQTIIQTISTPQGRLPDDPQMRIPGAVFAGHGVSLGFLSPEGRTTGALLPSGGPRTEITYGEGRAAVVSMVDAGAPVVLIDAVSFGLDVGDYDSWVAEATSRLGELEEIRRAAAVSMGLADSPAKAERAVPKVGLVSASPDDEADLQVLMMSMGKPHPAMPITGSVGVTVAALTVGTVVEEAINTAVSRELRIRIPVGILVTLTEQSLLGRTVGVQRTARTLAEARLSLSDRQFVQALDTESQEVML